MLENKTILDKDNNIVEECVSFTNNIPQFFEIKKDYKIVDAIDKHYIKPHWNGTEWEESATEEEIKTHEEENKVTKEPTEQEKLNAQLLQTNAQQQLINASLVKQIAELQKGGN